jgi:hypothetical protein
MVQAPAQDYNPVQYGERVSPLVAELTVDKVVLERQIAKGLGLSYRYGLLPSGVSQHEWEREPRRLRVFTGQQVATFGGADDTAFLNSRVTRVDGNFRQGFDPSRVALNSGRLYVSSMPSTADDLETIKGLGVTSVLDLTGAGDLPNETSK